MKKFTAVLLAIAFLLLNCANQSNISKEEQEKYPVKKTQEEMIERMMFAQVLETVRCFQEGVMTSVADANIGSIFGWGFAPFKGGTLQYINDYGLPEFVSRSRELAAKYGERFVPPKHLIDMAENGETF